MTDTSLRERSRARRRAAIERAALELFASRGYDATTLAQVAEEAEVAPRTVSMYFPSKLHLALSYATAAVERLAAEVGASPGSPTVEVITTWLARELEAHAEEMELSAAMLRTNPEIRGAETPELTAAMQSISAVLAADLGRDVDDVVVGLAGGAVRGVIDAVIQLGPKRATEAEAYAAATRVLEAVVRAARALASR